ncbi:MAG: ADP/ATP-dependent (S)-NAD(P)H-hydrate dehydratase, partial [Microbacterium sp.]
MLREWSGSDTVRFLRVPGADDDKRSRGVVALRTGSERYPGAAVLGVEGAWRAGCGFVRYDGPAAAAVLARRPETVIGAGGTVGAWVVGSGIDAEQRSLEETIALKGIITRGAPVIVIDAGALDLAPLARTATVLTPHAGEFARLREGLAMDATAPRDAEERAAQAVEVASRLNSTVLLKGAQTIVADADGEVRSVTNAPGWLAVAGAGDVLAGALGAL